MNEQEKKNLAQAFMKAAATYLGLILSHQAQAVAISAAIGVFGSSLHDLYTLAPSQAAQPPAAVPIVAVVAANPIPPAGNSSR